MELDSILKEEWEIISETELTDGDFISSPSFGIFLELNSAHFTSDSQMEQVRDLIKVAPQMLEALKRRIEWSNKYPSSRIYSGSAMNRMIQESDEIDNYIKDVLTKSKLYENS